MVNSCWHTSRQLEWVVACLRYTLCGFSARNSRLSLHRRQQWKRLRGNRQSADETVSQPFCFLSVDSCMKFRAAAASDLHVKALKFHAVNKTVLLFCIQFTLHCWPCGPWGPIYEHFYSPMLHFSVWCYTTHLSTNLLNSLQSFLRILKKIEMFAVNCRNCSLVSAYVVGLQCFCVHCNVCKHTPSMWLCQWRALYTLGQFWGVWYSCFPAELFLWTRDELGAMHLQSPKSYIDIS